METIKYILYEICIPSIVVLCLLAALLNIMVFSSRFYVKSRSSSLELTYSLALSDTWTSFVIALSLFWNSYKPVVLQWPHDTYCFPLTLEVRNKTVAAAPGATARGRRTVVTAVLIFGTFLFGWMPASILYILTAEDMPLYKKQSVFITVISIVVLVNIMAKTLTNPIIYATRIPEIRQYVIQKLLWRVFPGEVVSRAGRPSELEPLRTRCSQAHTHSVMV
uniref:G_PROTEIN_RECEP_F1_2 domain-containing protein n=1 Tax=Caenorhabditis japonica TaxID=281687 RepID=A0A8R1DSA6_CAEJA